MTSIQSLGIGAESLKLKDTFDKLEENEKKQLKPLQQKESDLKTEELTWDMLKNNISGIQKIANDFLSPAGLKSVSASSINFEAKVTGNALPGEYDILIKQLAQSQVLTSDKLEISDFKEQSLSEVAKANLAITISDSSGQKQKVTIPHYKSNLNNILSEINRQQSIINAGYLKNDDGSYQMIFTSKETGESSGFMLHTDDANLGSYINYDPLAENEKIRMVKEPQDAKIEINGMDVQRSSNSIIDAPNGLRIDLKKPGTGRHETFTIEENSEDRENKIKEFVEAINKTIDFVNQQTTAVVKNSKLIKSPLFGDQHANSIKINLVKMVSSLTMNSDFSGVFRLDREGKISFNEQDISKLAVGQIFSKKSKGNSYSSFLSTVSSINESFNKITARNGIIDRGYEKIEKETNINSKKMADKLAQIDSNLERYRKQFTELSIFYNKINNSSILLQGLLDKNSDNN